MLDIISLIIALIAANYILSLIGTYIEYRYLADDSNEIPTGAALSIGFLYFILIIGVLIHDKIKDFSIIKKSGLKEMRKLAEKHGKQDKDLDYQVEKALWDIK